MQFALRAPPRVLMAEPPDRQGPLTCPIGERSQPVGRCSRATIARPPLAHLLIPVFLDLTAAAGLPDSNGSVIRARRRRSGRIVLDDGIGTGKEQPFVSTVLPLHQVRRAALLALNGKDQCAPFWLTNMVTQDDDSVSHCSTHVKHRLLGCSVTRWRITPQASSLAPIGARGQSHHVTQAI